MCVEKQDWNGYPANDRSIRMQKEVKLMAI